MTDQDRTITQDELHAYVDGELRGERLTAIEAWLAAHPEDAALVATWRNQAELIRARFGAISNEALPEQLSLTRLAQSRRRSVVVIATAAVLAAFVVGGIVGWMARGAEAATRSDLDLFTADAIEAYRLYAVEVRHPVEVPGDQRPHLVEWLSKRLGLQLRAPDLDKIGLKLVGGRLLPGPTGPSAFFMYEGPSGERFTLYCGRTADRETALRYTAGDQNGAYYWVDQNLAYVLSGPAEREKLYTIAQAAYDQIDTRTPPRGG
ncbi:MAG TPA: anti-sigma factor [Xanthobacteraceae bacterium]|nr:anti-sigma factor [Xanthobacteraceae bacterium]